MQEKSLDELRDEKCVPIVNDLIQELAKDMMPENANEGVNYTPIVTTILQKFLEENTNITTENDYIFQLILGSLSGLNGAINKSATLPIDNIRYVKVCKELLNILAKSGIEFGPATPNEISEKYEILLPDINELFAREKINTLESKYITDAIFETFKAIQGMVGTSIEKSMSKAEAKLFSVEDMTDVTMSMLDKILKS